MSKTEKNIRYSRGAVDAHAISGMFENPLMDSDDEALGRDLARSEIATSARPDDAFIGFSEEAKSSPGAMFENFGEEE